MPQIRLFRLDAPLPQRLHFLNCSTPTFPGIPPWSQIRIEVALNSQQFVAAHDARTGSTGFVSFDPGLVVLQQVSPPAGPRHGNTVFVLRGENFAPPDTQKFSPLVSPVARIRPLNSLPVCRTNAEPDDNCRAPLSSGALPSASELTEMFACGDAKDSSQTLTCLPTPAYAPGMVLLDLSLNGGVDFTLSLNLRYYQFYELPVLDPKDPKPAQGVPSLIFSHLLLLV